jgi:preprotein translocase subunit SecB
MKEETQMSTDTNEATGEAMVLPITVHAQYIKDFSFENPNPLESFKNENNAQPNISVGIQAKADNLGGRNFEVILEIRIDATREKTPLFVTELSYAGIVTLGDDVSENEAGPLLMIECPRLIFPFARNILADVTRDGGFPPLMLAPVDFAALYEQQKNQATTSGKESKPAKNGKDK